MTFKEPITECCAPVELGIHQDTCPQLVKPVYAFQTDTLPPVRLHASFEAQGLGETMLVRAKPLVARAIVGRASAS